MLQLRNEAQAEDRAEEAQELQRIRCGAERYAGARLAEARLGFSLKLFLVDIAQMAFGTGTLTPGFGNGRIFDVDADLRHLLREILAVAGRAGRYIGGTHQGLKFLVAIFALEGVERHGSWSGLVQKRVSLRAVMRCRSRVRPAPETALKHCFNIG